MIKFTYYFVGWSCLNQNGGYLLVKTAVNKGSLEKH